MTQLHSSEDPSDDDDYTHCLPETLLWRSVLYQAFIDALDHADERDIFSDYAWFNPRRRDFLMVCAFAGADPHFLCRQLHMASESPDRWRPSLHNFMRCRFGV